MKKNKGLQWILDALRALGNGNLQTGKNIFCALAAKLVESRKYYPFYTATPKGALCFINEEYEELDATVSFGNLDYAEDVALDLAAVVIRFVGNEFEEGETWKTRGITRAGN